MAHMEYNRLLSRFAILHFCTNEAYKYRSNLGFFGWKIAFLLRTNVLETNKRQQNEIHSPIAFPWQYFCDWWFWKENAVYCQRYRLVFSNGWQYHRSSFYLRRLRWTLIQGEIPYQQIFVLLFQDRSWELQERSNWLPFSWI